jgi:uncharacterized protein YidB (DUF937 family)
MGLLDGLLGSVLGSVLGGQQTGAGGLGSLASVVGGMLGNDGDHGGIGGLVSKFEQAGLGNVVSSWISSSQNLPISADQLKSVLGSDAVAGIAAKLGINPADALGQLSTMLPGLVDKLTPSGIAPASGIGNMGDLTGMLGSLLARQ